MCGGGASIIAVYVTCLYVIVINCEMLTTNGFFVLQHPLHKKKLHLALHCYRGLPGDSYLIPAGYLDTTWVLRWLDDAGLPQHKDAFLAARVDGRLLHRLTVDDLATLHVTSVLHVASIRTGIQVTR